MTEVMTENQPDICRGCRHRIEQKEPALGLTFSPPGSSSGRWLFGCDKGHDLKDGGLTECSDNQQS
jgi:hypothetical protein